MKKRIFTVALVVALLATCFAGTYAYLIDSEAQKNTFTTGNVYISMNEAVVEKEEATGNLVATGERTEEDQEYHLFPGMTVTKDPTIYVEGTEAAYVAAKVTVTGNLYDLIGMADTDMIDIHKVASGGLLDAIPTAKSDWNGLTWVHETTDCVIYQKADKANNTWVLYIFMNGPQAVDTKIELFDTLTIPAEWDNEEMAKINNMEIHVQAFATQTNGFADCYAAMTTAHKDAFSFS